MTIATYYLLLMATAIALAIPVLNSVTDERVVRTEPGLRLRLISAGWFALTACLPVGLFWVILILMLYGRSTDEQTPFVFAFVWILGGLPIVAAALCGFTRGVRILDPLKVRTSFQAVRRGFTVGFFSYLVFAITSLTLTAIYSDSSRRRELLLFALLVLAVGAILIGWLVVLVTSIGGWLLYRLSRVEPFQQRLRSSRSVSKSAALNWTIAAMVVFHVCSVPGSLSFRAAMKQEMSKNRNRQLYVAINDGNAEHTERLLREGADPNTWDQGLLPLSVAARDHQTQLIEILLRYGADPNALDGRNGYQTPLMEVVSQGDLAATKTLLDHGARVNTLNSEGHTPLMKAVMYGTPEMVSVLLAHGADLNLKDSNADPEKRKTVFALALARRAGTEVAGYDSRDASGIAEAGKRQNEIIRMLRAAGAKD